MQLSSFSPRQRWRTEVFEPGSVAANLEHVDYSQVWRKNALRVTFRVLQTSSKAMEYHPAPPPDRSSTASGLLATNSSVVGYCCPQHWQPSRHVPPTPPRQPPPRAGHIVQQHSYFSVSRPHTMQPKTSFHTQACWQAGCHALVLATLATPPADCCGTGSANRGSIPRFRRTHSKARASTVFRVEGGSSQAPGPMALRMATDNHSSAMPSSMPWCSVISVDGMRGQRSKYSENNEGWR